MKSVEIAGLGSSRLTLVQDGEVVFAMALLREFVTEVNE